ncbi:MAG TPA: type II secretion system protein GspM [Bryobacteraceae bacterium]|jgi:type II secretion system (T2SS) protein M|nr:type II secretion system protein GspM [Bryobacteraceae bacterium]
MKLETRDRRALLLLAVAAAAILLFRLKTASGPEVVEASVDSVEMAEKKLAKMKQLSAAVPGKEALLKQAGEQLAAREAGVIAAETAQQAQAQLLQTIRAVGKKENIDARGGEFGPVRPLGEDYGEVTVAVTFECGIDQLVNFLAALTSEKALLATSEVRISLANPKEKTVAVRLALSGVVPRKLVPEQKGSALF